jgi:hypothetical protein
LGGLKVRDHWEDLGIHGSITLRWTLGRYEMMGQSGFGWQALVGMVMNLQVP